MPDVEMTSIVRELGHGSMDEARRAVAGAFDAS
jgi:lipoyl(octanoyl) transferase